MHLYVVGLKRIAAVVDHNQLPVPTAWREYAHQSSLNACPVMARQLTENEKALEALMHEAANLPRTRGGCKWATINGHEIMCAPTYKASGEFLACRFVVDGKSMKAADLWQAVRA